MIRFSLIILLLTTIVQATPKPNVLFISVDDMNDWASPLGGYPGKVHTPNMERLGKLGVTFLNAHTASPVCCPSRTAIMLGLRPSTTGIYNNGQWWRPHLPDTVSIPMYFRQHGYKAIGAGKVFHHTAGFNPPDQWDDFQRLVFKDDPWFRGNKLNYPWSMHKKKPSGYPFSGLKDTPHEGDWGAIPGLIEINYDDSRTVDYAVEVLKEKHKKPFFLACGIFRPHLPWYAPRKYFEMYPINKIELPETPEDDLQDIPTQGRKLSASRRSEFLNIKKHGKWKEAIQAYLASISFADAQLGRLLETLDKSIHKNQTIIVFWSDHGWHLGEKNHWHKSTLWEEATRIPFIISVPGMTKGGTHCYHPVDTLSIYPTLIELCGLKAKKNLDGVSIAPLLADPQMPWDTPAITEFKRGQCAVRSIRYRYIRYSDGTEELYDHSKDPNEWTNLASNSEHSETIKNLSRSIPNKFASDAPSKGSYEFDPKKYVWTHRETGNITSGNKR
ncbi:MAG: sulfatase [Opitutae bacterium]|nr:sulfatase [Opitutae bacterium]